MSDDARERVDRYRRRAAALRDVLDGARIEYEIVYPGTDVEAVLIERPNGGPLIAGPTKDADVGYDVAGFTPGHVRTFFTRRPSAAEVLTLIEENR